MDKVEGGEKLSPLQKAAYALKEMRSKLDAMERTQNEPIAIIGMSGRFPGANNPDEYWQLLRDGVDAVTEIPAERWPLETYYDPNPNAPGKISIRCGGFLSQSQVEQFDPHFFGISPREAVKLDPQHRLLLEVSWEALENAGQSPKALLGSQTGTFIGIDQMDYSLWQLTGDPAKFDVYSTTSNGFCFASGRLSYTLGLHGPNMPIDTACSSSLVALHLACQSLRTQECNLAIVGGVQLMLSPEFLLVLTKTQSLSPSNRCRTFDAAADGYILGEGCGVVVLKRLSEALANRDNILAIILASGVNHGGASSGITVPNELAEEGLIRQVINKAKVAPAEVNYVETHGTGTTLGDPIEVGALSAVFSERPKDDPLVLGAVKTNLGHLNAAAGMAGLIKTVLAFQHEEIPPNLHFKEPNPHIDWDKCSMKVPTSLLPWLRGDKRRVAGVSSFGISGTNAHVLLEEAPVRGKEKGESDKGRGTRGKEEGDVERPQHLLTLSAKSDKALRELALAYETYLKSPKAAELADVCFTANAGRSHFNHRLAIVADSPVQLQEQLGDFLQQTEKESIFIGELPARGKVQLKIAFLFTGDESQYVGMGQQLYETQPTFRKTLDRCDEILREIPPFEKGLLGGNSGLGGNSQPALFALEYALAELWQSWGIKPAVVMGHGVGEYVAACVAGVFSLEEGLKLIAERGQLMQSFEHLSGNEKKSRVDSYEQMAHQMTFIAPRIAMMSSLTGQLWPSKIIPDANHWRRALEETEPLTVGINTLVEKGYKHFLEIGPKPILNERYSSQTNEVVWLSSLAPGKDEWQVMLSSLSHLYVQGTEINWEGFDKDYSRMRTPLPTYPFQRKRYWLSKEDLQKTTFAPSERSPEMPRQPEIPQPGGPTAVTGEQKNLTGTPETEMPPPGGTTAVVAKEAGNLTGTPETAMQPRAASATEAQTGTPKTVGTTPALARVMNQQLQAASQAVSQVVSQQLAFLRGSGIALKAGKVPPKAARPQNEAVKAKDAPRPLSEVPKTAEVNALAGDEPSKGSTPTNDKGNDATVSVSADTVLSLKAKDEDKLDWQLLLLSAKTEAELETETQKVIEQLKQSPDKLAEIAHALRNSETFNHRRMLVCRNINDAIKTLEALDPKRVITQYQEPVNRPITFMFPGVGDHYINMARGLYQTQSVFREHVDECCETLLPYLRQDLREIIYHEGDKAADSKAADTAKPRFDLRKMLKREPADEHTQKLNQTIFSQPAVFVIEYALAKLWMSYGIRPQAMIGYSIGEYTAACLAEVISLEDTLRLLTKRALMIQELPAGAMLAVPVSEEKILPMLGDELSLATMSTPLQCVVAGPPNAISELEHRLQEQQVLCRRLQTSHAFHSKMMEPLKEPLTKLVGTFTLNRPQIPYLSNVTGTWITKTQATDPQSWAQHTYSAVRFSDGIGELLQTPGQIFLEVGPGQSLGSFVFQHPAFQNVHDSVMVLPSLRTMYDGQPDAAFLLNSLGKLWLGGKTIESK